jgi:hypothetical protein
MPRKRATAADAPVLANDDAPLLNRGPGGATGA